MTMTNATSADRYRTLRVLGALACLSVALGGCNTTNEVVTASVPDDYRHRHPIAIHEADRAVVIFVGAGRGGLTPSQVADVRGLAQTWAHEGTGAIVAEVPVGTPNARAAAYTFREIKSMLAAGGVPSRGITLRNVQPEDPAEFVPITLRYPRIAAVAGPCGLWPADLGPSVLDPNYFENKEYHNFGCASQRNLAAMVENPADLVQPRPETPAYTERRTEAFEKYRKGNSTATSYPESDKAKLSDTGK
jgi:pilus assembly protein CpaD